MNSFLNSEKRHLVITGSRQTGKTTLLRALCPQRLPGLTTRAIPRKEVLLCENLTENKAVIGVYDQNLPGSENKMRLRQEGFSSLALEALGRCLSSRSDRITIDEIGYLEFGVPEYINALVKLFREKQIFCTVRKQMLPFLYKYIPENTLFVVDLDKPYGNTCCVIMASGMSMRFGSNKLMEDFGGEPMFMRTVRATEGIFSKRVVVTRHISVFDICLKVGIEAVLHDKPFRSDTVRVGLESVYNTNACMFCPADQPLLKRETVASLALCAANDHKHIYRAGHDGSAGSPAVFPQWAYAELSALTGAMGGGYVMNQYPSLLRLLPVQDPLELSDADTPEMLNHLRGML